MSDDIRDWITLIEQSLIPQPNTLRVDVTSYEFSRLMQEYRAEETLEASNNSGLVMFYTDSEKDEFKQFLIRKGITFKDIGTE